MLSPGEIHVWRIVLDQPPPERLHPPSAGEAARAARFRDPRARERYLHAHRALRTILAGLTSARLDFGLTEKGKPYLPGDPGLRFNLSRSDGIALIAAGRGIDVGVDVERRRPIPEYEAIAERFFPPSEWAALSRTAPEDRERDFFRRWTRLEAMLKARGIGLYGAGIEQGGQWTVHDVDAGENYAAAVAATAEGMQLLVHDFD